MTMTSTNATPRVRVRCRARTTRQHDPRACVCHAHAGARAQSGCCWWTALVGVSTKDTTLAMSDSPDAMQNPARGWHCAPRRHAPGSPINERRPGQPTRNCRALCQLPCSLAALTSLPASQIAALSTRPARDKERSAHHQIADEDRCR